MLKYWWLSWLVKGEKKVTSDTMYEGIKARLEGQAWRDNPYRHKIFNTYANQSRWSWWHTGWEIQGIEDDDDRETT